MNDLTLKQSWPDERRYQYLITGISDYAIYMLDPVGNITNWNSGAEARIAAPCVVRRP